MGEPSWHLLETISDEWAAFAKRRALLNRACRRRLAYRSKVVRKGGLRDLVSITPNTRSVSSMAAELVLIDSSRSRACLPEARRRGSERRGGVRQ